MGFGHAIPHIVERFINKLEYPIKIYGNDQTRAFCYIDDAVRELLEQWKVETNQIAFTILEMIKKSLWKNLQNLLVMY